MADRVDRPSDPDRPVAAADRSSTGVSPAIHTIELRKEFKRTTALSGLSMTVRRGEVFGFLGPNGAGKTTAVKLLLGLMRPSAGEAMVLGAPAGDQETRRRIGYLPELFRYQGWLSADEVLTFHGRLLGLPGDRVETRRTEVLHLVGLGERRSDKVASFSKGMQQRLGLGVALLGEPELVILDEPTSALDPVGRHDVREIIRELRERGTSVFLNTHLLEEAEHVCDRVTVIDHGRAVATGTLDELLGTTSTVRLRLSGITDEQICRVPGMASCRREGEWLVVRDVDEDQVPDLVGAIIAAGGRIAAVVPAHRTLEERFLELLAEEQ